MDNTINKSHVAEAFGYDNPVKIDFSGKQIKQALRANRLLLENKRNHAEHEMVELLEKIGCEPTRKVDEWQTNGMYAVLPELPKGFRHEETYSQPSETGEYVPEEKEDVWKLKREYNDELDIYVKSFAEMALVDSLLGNLQDEKTYKIPAVQAAKLGL